MTGAKFATLIATIIIFSLCISSAESLRCRRQIRTCNVTLADGSWELTSYSCGQTCCGNTLYNTTDHLLKCCGDETFGEIYNVETQKCCTFNFQKTHRLHTNFTSADFCCGTSLFRANQHRDGVSCCSGWQTEAEFFNVRTEMCCDGVRQFSGDTAFTSCCGQTSYDRRIASCPCNNKVVAVGIAQNLAGCCQNPNGTRTGYNTETQKCCNGNPYLIDSEFCCGNVIGLLDSQVCCDGVLASNKGANTTKELACCAANDGTTSVYDTSIEICCNGSISAQSVIPEEVQVCCGNTLYIEATDGDECCNGVPFISATSVCCNNNVSFGDRCCNDVAYSSSNQICCGGLVNIDVNYQQAACCGDQSFDALSQTCCGTTVFDNNILPNGGISRTTRCCGDFAAPDTLTPYDYTLSTCCEGSIEDLGNVTWDRAQCCGRVAVDASEYMCCEDVPVERWYAEETDCCSGQPINSTITMCCGGVAQPRNLTTECCGTDVYDITTSKCCNNIPRSLNGVDPDKAICCGDGCIDGTTTWCCNGKQFQKGSNIGADVAGLECNQVFPK